MSVAAFSDIAKKPNDLLTRDFFHLSPASLDVKTSADNGVTFTARGKSSPKDGSISGALEAKYSDKSGIALTQSWSTSNAIDTKFELPPLIPNLTSNVATTFIPSSGSTNAKLSLAYKQPLFQSNAVVDILKGPTFTTNFSFGKAGVIAGGEISYDVPVGRVTNYAAGLGYGAGNFAVALTAVNKLSIISAAYYTKATPAVEVGAKATLDTKSTSQVNVELGAKYTIDATTSAKVKISNTGLVSLGYLQTIHPGVKLGLGAAVDTQRLAEPAHKLGFSFSFEA
ncbi:eukaryotic porin/Tom40 [Lipomyces chichibuensis]|uniref:eukaryotic porin/Tom40 n=1 Tax=Lipomyces chichibuensis TaxID=1546026 RepID=UPI003343DC19